MIPKCVPIRREEDFHTHYVGIYGNGLQYMGFPFFAERNQTRPVSVLHLLDTDGRHVSSQIWEFEKMNMAEKALQDAITQLPEAQPGNISVQPFSVKLNGLTFGLVTREDGKCIEYVPYGLAFFPPWNGAYET